MRKRGGGKKTGQPGTVDAVARAVGRGAVVALLATSAGCRSPEAYRVSADRRGTELVERYRRQAVGRDAPFEVERPSDLLRRRLLREQGLPEVGPTGTVTVAATSAGPLRLSLVDALKVGTRNSREYQDAKEAIFGAALDLDTEQNAFRTTLAGVLSGSYDDSRGGETPRRGVVGSAETSATRLFRTGASITTKLAFDVAKLLTLDRDSAMGLLADATITVPLLRGAGARIVAEPLTQAERNVIYAIYDFERFRRDYAVRVGSEYLGVLDSWQQIVNAEENDRSLTDSAERAARLAEAGRLPEIQVDQARQDQLRARERLISARQSYQRDLDGLKVTLGLPADARIALATNELAVVAAEAPVVPPVEAASDGDGEAAPAPVGDLSSATWYGMDAEHAVAAALRNRLDLRRARGRLEDAQRAVDVAADALRAGLKLQADAATGGRRDVSSATQPDARLQPSQGHYSAQLQLDLPWERTSERNAYRKALVDLDAARRKVEDLGDSIKREVRDDLRNLLQNRESCAIQRTAVEVALRRVESTRIFLDAGRAEIRDVLEAQESLISAQNALTEAQVSYRIAELNLQRDMEVLEISEEGIWHEFRPKP